MEKKTDNEKGRNKMKTKLNAFHSVVLGKIKLQIR